MLFYIDGDQLKVSAPVAGSHNVTVRATDNNGETFDKLFVITIDAADPYFANVVLLCGFEGADAATSFTDESSTPATLTANGDAQLDTAQKKYGASSLLLDGTGDYVSAADSADWNFGSGQFTIEAWIRLPEAGTAYANPGGTGDRTSSITVTTDATTGASTVNQIVDGTTANEYWWQNGQSGKYLRFDFGTARLITEALWKQDSSGTHGTWKWQGSSDASTWTDIGSTFTLGGATSQTHTTLSGNATFYRYYQMQQTVGTTSSGPFLQEIEFKINGTSGESEWTVVSQTSASTSLAAWAFYHTGGTLTFRFYEDFATPHDTTATFAPSAVGAWHHLAVDRDGSGYVRLYVDGAMLAKALKPAAVQDVATSLRIGSSEGSSGLDFPGHIDELRITKGVARYASDSGYTVPSGAYPRS